MSRGFKAQQGPYFVGIPSLDIISLHPVQSRSWILLSRLNCTTSFDAHFAMYRSKMSETPSKESREVDIRASNFRLIFSLLLKVSTAIKSSLKLSRTYSWDGKMFATLVFYDLASRTLFLYNGRSLAYLATIADECILFLILYPIPAILSYMLHCVTELRDRYLKNSFLSDLEVYCSMNLYCF